MPSRPRIRRAEIAAAALTFAVTLALRVWGISSHFPLLRDQIRDWDLALQPFGQLPLVGPATHVGGYTIGPAFYWILWLIRVTVGPWFDNLPHGGGVGQAALQSGADVLLLLAIWRRFGSAPAALAVVVFLATSAFDLHLAAVVWNPVVGATLAKMAIALVLLGWHRANAPRVGATVALAWAAVHAYTGAVFVAVGVLAATIVDPAVRRDRSGLRRNALVTAVVLALLQVPYVLHQVRHRFGDEAMGAVTASVRDVVTGRAAPEVAKSVSGYVEAVQFVQAAPARVPYLGWLLLACAAVVLARHRRDAPLLAVLLLPQAAALAGYALFLAALEHYYYLSLMPVIVLTVVLALTAAPVRAVAAVTAAALLVGSIALVPGRLRFRETLPRFPEYGALVEASRRIAARGVPMRAIRTDFALPPTTDPEFLYRILGGRIDRGAEWSATVSADGQVRYLHGPGR